MPVSAQTIGLRGSIEGSNNRFANGAIGFGVFANPLYTETDLGILLYADFATNTRIFNDCINCPSLDIKTKYRKISGGFSAMINLEMNSNTMDFKIGPDVSYHMFLAQRQGLLLNWSDRYSSHYVGIGIMANLTVYEIMYSPFNLEFFVTPTNYFKLNNFGETRNNSILENHLFHLNAQVGLSYQF